MFLFFTAIANTTATTTPPSPKTSKKNPILFPFLRDATSYNRATAEQRSNNSREDISSDLATQEARGEVRQ
ncbi:hypothetical protein CDL15_Pgr010811 [Punica granatum]|uniref:Uncharacterized protein n=1 Tax=Punica granatum TaxID=22663 RepID=A0A218W5Q4_PUNGR|nr:hypothetical protein CDL15_Pgr010811 [Punica granatum]